MLNIDEFNLVNYFSMSCEKAWYIALICIVQFCYESSPTHAYIIIEILTPFYFELGEFVTFALLASVNPIVLHSCNVITYSVMYASCLILFIYRLYPEVCHHTERW